MLNETKITIKFILITAALLLLGGLAFTVVLYADRIESLENANNALNSEIDRLNAEISLLNAQKVADDSAHTELLKSLREAKNAENARIEKIAALPVDWLADPVPDGLCRVFDGDISTDHAAQQSTHDL